MCIFSRRTTQTQEEAQRRGVLRRTNQTQKAWAYSHNGPIVMFRCAGADLDMHVDMCDVTFQVCRY
eukprot:1182385-Prorocentrum_minimum.AAC.2